MTAYAIGHLHDVVQGQEILAYLQAIDTTLEPFGGRFLVHGGKAGVLEGRWSGDLVIIALPDRTRALAWYHSAVYQKILPLRLKNAKGDVVIVDGVPRGHRATDVLTAYEAHDDQRS
jgi:uncharacterized protein (DUF1330 family)